jgi:FkbM family methyltransferase
MGQLQVPALPISLSTRVLIYLARHLSSRFEATRLGDVAAYHAERGLARAVRPGTVTCGISATGALVVIPMVERSLRHFYVTGRYEQDVEAISEAVLEHGDTVIDVGANIGIHTLNFARLIGPTGHVHSFEPSPEVAALLRRSIEANGWTDRITLHEQAVSNFEGELELYVDDAAASLTASTARHPWLESARRVSVPAATLDSCMLDVLRRPPKLLKVDVEGAELQVFQGAASLFDRHPPKFVIAEFSPMVDGNSVVDWLVTRGYEPVELRGEEFQGVSPKLPPASSAQVGDAGFSYANVAFRYRSRGS